MKKKINDNYYSQVKASFTSYISIVIKNASINYKKKKKMLESIELEYNDKTIEDISLLSNSDMSFFNSFEKKYSYEQLENYFSNCTLYTIIKQLSITQKKILYYRVIKDYSYEQIALIMEISESNIRNIKHRTIRKIKSKIKNIKGGVFYGK